MAAFVAGLHAATAMFAAVYGVPAATSRAAHIDISAQETFLQHWSRHIGQWSYSGAGQRRDRRTLDGQGVPSMARAADGWICLAVRNARWNTVASLLGLDHFTGDDWQTPRSPRRALVRHRAALRLVAWPRARATRGSRAAAERGLIFGPVQDLPEVLAQRPIRRTGLLRARRHRRYARQARRDCHSHGRCKRARMAFETILFDVQDGIARVTLNRPDRLNAMTWLMIEEFLEAIEICRRDDSVRVLVFTGAGRAFSAGDDIVGGMGDRRLGGNPGGINNDRGLHHALVKILLELPKPVVAALNGRCHGAGFVLSLACDFRVGHTETLVGDIRSGRAIFAGQGVPLLLPRLIGQSRAMDLLITGRVIDGAEAERIGLLEPAVAAFDLRGGPRRVSDRARQWSDADLRGLEADRQSLRPQRARRLHRLRAPAGQPHPHDRRPRRRPRSFREKRPYAALRGPLKPAYKTLVDNRVQAADAYVLALRTGEIPASKNASQYLAPDVVLTVGSGARKTTVTGYDDVLARISGEWPNTPVFVRGFWSAARLEGDKARVDATFPPMGAAPAEVHLTFAFNADGKIYAVDQEVVPQPAAAGHRHHPRHRPRPDQRRPAQQHADVRRLRRRGRQAEPVAARQRPGLQPHAAVDLAAQQDRRHGQRPGQEPERRPAVPRQQHPLDALVQGVGHVETDPEICARVWNLIQDVEQKHETHETGCALIIDVTRMQGGTPRGGVRMQR